MSLPLRVENVAIRNETPSIAEPKDVAGGGSVSAAVGQVQVGMTGGMVGHQGGMVDQMVSVRECLSRQAAVFPSAARIGTHPGNLEQRPGQP